MNSDEIDERFFNFSPEMIATVRAYHRSHDPALVQPIFDGIMQKYLPEALLAADTNSIPGEAFYNAFGLESVTLLEVVLDLQDALGIRMTDDEVRGMSDLKEAHALLVQKVEALRRGEQPSTPAVPAA